MSDPAASHLKPTLLLMSGRFAGFLATFLVPVVLVRIFDQAEFGTGDVASAALPSDTPPSAIHLSSCITSRADCHRSSGSFARHLATM